MGLMALDPFGGMAEMMRVLVERRRRWQVVVGEGVARRRNKSFPQLSGFPRDMGNRGRGLDQKRWSI
jgi:hypothetical protein